MNYIIFIVGPTATGKSEVAFKLAKKLGGEIVSCDSMLVYKEPQVITSKPDSYMLKEVKHHFINVVSVTEVYDVFTYFKEASKLIMDLVSQKIPVVVCGGTGLYVKAVLDGIFEGARRDFSLREKLTQEADLKGRGYLYQKLKEVDPKTADRVSPNDLRRIIRALEVYYLVGEPISKKQRESRGLWGKLSIRMFGLTLKRNLLYERVNKRVDKMFDKGAVEEVKNLLKLNLSFTAKKIIGLKEIGSAFKGEISLDEARELMKKNTRNFAKRQVTWFKKDSRIEWLDIERESNQTLSEEILRRCTKQQS